MNDKIICNMRGKTLYDSLRDLGTNADEIRIAVAFFTDPGLINQWLERRLRVNLIVQLGLPTAPSALKSVRARMSSDDKIKFFGAEFHAKVHLFLRAGSPFAATVGSSNSTSAGLSSNIEANVVIDSPDQLSLLQGYLNEMWRDAADLEPEDLRKYEEYFKAAHQPAAFVPRTGKLPRRDRRRVMKLSPIAANYLRFWGIADQVRDMVEDISKREWPGIPLYLTVDHFWHWVKIKWQPKEPESARRSDTWKLTHIPALFKQYADWDKDGTNHTTKMHELSKQMASLLSQENVSRISSENADWVYRHMHAGGVLSQRFSRNASFVRENQLIKIRKTWQYLLWSDADIQVRISDVLTNPEYKLRFFKDSTVQELIGWVKPEQMPMRNQKADFAVRKLGFDF